MSPKSRMRKKFSTSLRYCPPFRLPFAHPHRPRLTRRDFMRAIVNPSKPSDIGYSASVHVALPIQVNSKEPDYCHYNSGNAVFRLVPRLNNHGWPDQHMQTCHQISGNMDTVFTPLAMHRYTPFNP